MEKAPTVLTNASGSILGVNSRAKTSAKCLPAAAKKPEPAVDMWDEVNTFRKVLKENSQGYLVVTASFVVGGCFLVSIVAGSILAMPAIAAVCGWDQLRKFMGKRAANKSSETTLSAVPVSESE